MRLLLLNGPTIKGFHTPPTGNPSYRGTDRKSLIGGVDDPSWPEQIKELRRGYFEKMEHVWDRYHSGLDINPELKEDIDRLGMRPNVVYDLETARELTNTYKDVLGQEYMILEVTLGDAAPEIGGRLLGFDISVGYDESSIWGSLEPVHPDERRITDIYTTRELLMRAYTLDLLIWKYFDPLLNENGLFDDFETASFFRDCIKAVPYIAPELYEPEETSENPGWEWEVLGLYVVDMDLT